MEKLHFRQYIYEPTTPKEQFSLFDFKPAKREKKVHLPPGQRVRVATIGNVRAAGNAVSGLEDVASLLASIPKSDQKNFQNLLT